MYFQSLYVRNEEEPETLQIYDNNDPAPPMTTRTATEDEYLIVNLKKTQELLNIILKNHDKNCKGTVTLNSADKRIISSSIAAKCTSCSYTLSPHKMYPEVKSNARGRKRSCLNLALGATMQTLPINDTNFIHLAAGIGIDPPSHSGMHQLANVCNDINVFLGNKSISHQVELAKARKKITSEFNVSEDAMYSNPIFASNTPTHAANQAYLTVMNQENNKVVHVGIYNKQCHRAKMISAKTGQTIKCCTDKKNHDGQCSANLPSDAPIGREAEYVLRAAESLRKQGADPTSVTKDGDAAVRKALLKFYGEENIEIFNDEHHLNGCFKKKVKTTNFTNTMFNVRTKRQKQIELNNFAEDLASRCYGEIKSARKEFKTLKACLRKNQVLKSLSMTPKAILSCIKGNHSNCTAGSFLCNPEAEGGSWKFTFLESRNSIVNLDPSDEKKIETLLTMRIGQNALRTLWRGTSTQINEAFNRKIRKHLPKSTNFTRNCTGRVKSAAFHQNEGYFNATKSLHRAIGFRICKKVDIKLAREEARQKYQQRYQRATSSKTKRFQRKFFKYRTHRMKNGLIQTNNPADNESDDYDDDDDDDNNHDSTGYSKHAHL